VPGENGIVQVVDHHRDALEKIANLHDLVGIVSVYVDAGPIATEGREASAVEVRNAVRSLERANALDREGQQALTARLAALEPELDELLSPRGTGRGRALFAQIRGNDVHRIALQLPLTTAVSVGERASLRPLLVALDEGRPAGLVLLSRSEVRTLELAMGAGSDVARRPIELDSEDWREMRGPADPKPLKGQESSSQDDRFARRLDEQLRHLLEPEAEHVAALATKRDWDVLVLAGDPELVAPFQATLVRDDSLGIVLDPRDLGAYLAPAEIAGTLAPLVAAARARRAHAAAERARDAALSGGNGSVGLADTAGALFEGRVHELVLDATPVRPGNEAPDGRVVAPGLVPGGTSEAALRAVPDVTDWMLARALSTGAAITLLSGEAASALAQHDGVAALLRW
jgi:hypothetical protein